MSKNDAPPKKKAKTDPTSLIRQQLDYLESHADKDHTIIHRSQPRDDLPPPPEFVNNVQGSSSGAGSGEFHVYKASRRREYERISLMEAKNEEERQQLEFKFKREQQQRLDEERTEKNRAKREKAKAAKQRAIQAEKERKASSRTRAEDDILEKILSLSTT